ncbi:hypothetical protein M9458_031305, partial [Cirrhinus mrigala]
MKKTPTVTLTNVISCWICTLMQECPSSITANLSVSSCRLDHKALREKELHPPRCAETPNREETNEESEVKGFLQCLPYISQL